MNIHDFKDQIVTAAATAALLGGGGSIISAKIELGRHDERIERIEGLSEEMKALRNELVDTRVKIAELKGEADEPSK